MSNNFWNKIVDKKVMSMFQKAHRAAHRRAIKKHLPFEITVDDMLNQYVIQDGRCFYSGMEMRIFKETKENLHDHYKMTLDCKNPALGYIKQNIVWCIYCINSFKQRMEKEELINICKSILENNEKDKGR